jgi:hypothetical protein
LQDRPRLLGKARRNIVRHRAQIDVEPATAGERHLQHREQYASVRTVVVGEQQLAILHFAQRGKQR